MEKNEFNRVSCLEVLSDHMNFHIVDLVEKDLYSANKNLKIAAIRALGHFIDPKSIYLLIPLLNDNDWEVRALSARSLGYLKANEAISELALLLKDDVWWVRMNSALALKKMGAKGKSILKQQNINEDFYAFEIAQYVLALDQYE